jgi:hypothetical protein
MLAKRAFFSFLELTDPTKHKEFNEYHQLDHRPENLALPGVAWGDRWVIPPDCAELTTGSDEAMTRIQYVAMYWFADPVDQSQAEWVELGALACQWGRRPETDWARRDVGFFRPLKGYVNPRVLVSADALPFRPVRGMHVTCVRVLEPGTSAAERAFAWYDRVHIPDLLTCRGVAGAWTFSSDATSFDREGRSVGAGLRVHVLYLDQDPLEVVADIAQRTKEWEAAGRMMDLDGVIDERLATPLRPITPWQWDWFD